MPLSGELLTLRADLSTKKAAYSLGESYSIILTSFCLIIDPRGGTVDEKSCIQLAHRGLAILFFSLLHGSRIMSSRRTSNIRNTCLFVDAPSNRCLAVSINEWVSVKNKAIRPHFLKFLMALATIGIVYTHSPHRCVSPSWLSICSSISRQECRFCQY